MQTKQIYTVPGVNKSKKKPWVSYLLENTSLNKNAPRKKIKTKLADFFLSPPSKFSQCKILILSRVKPFKPCKCKIQVNYNYLMQHSASTHLSMFNV